MAEEYPMTRREDIQPFLFPCGNCRQYIFHAVYEQPYGFGVKLIFMKSPLWSSKKGYQVVCEKCDIVNGQLQVEDVNKLAMNMLPKSIYTAYPPIHQFYMPGYYQVHRAELVGDPADAELAPLIDKWMANYRLEV